jgi:arylsulfatase A-like enzyme
MNLKTPFSLLLLMAVNVSAALSVATGPSTVLDDATTGEMSFSNISVQTGDVVAIASAPNKTKATNRLSLTWSGTEGADGDTSTVESDDLNGRACYVFYVKITNAGTYDFTVTPANSSLTARSSLWVLRSDAGAVAMADTAIMAQTTSSPGLAYTFTNSVSEGVAIESFAAKSGTTLTTDPAYTSEENSSGRHTLYSTSVSGTSWNKTHTSASGALAYVGAGAVFAETVTTPQPPSFKNAPTTKPEATEGASYSTSLSSDASDPNGDAMTFWISPTNTWLSATMNGALSGTPQNSDIGTNTWTVYVTDGISGTNSATLQVEVVAQTPPDFSSDPVIETTAVTNQAYSATLSDNASDSNSDTMTFSFSPTNTWLSVATNGALSGTPQSSDIGTNTWTVYVTDGIGGTNSATLQITVGATPTYSHTNFVFICIDDLGWMDLSVQGSEFYETPRIDELAATGMRFTQGYTPHPRCLPARYGLMSGRFPGAMGVPGGPENNLRPSETTIAEVLQTAGYETAFMGKWHLIGTHGTSNLPQNQGFDINISGGKPGAPPSYFYPYGNQPSDELDKNGLYLDNATPAGGMVTDRITGASYKRTATRGASGEYITDRLTDEAIDWMEWNKDKPMFLCLWHYGVHTPFEAPSALITKYQNKLSSMTYDRPEYINAGVGQQKMRQNYPEYAAMIDSVDTNIGRLIDKIEDLGLTENTVIFFTSDNGGLSNRGGNNTRTLATSNYPLRTGKGWLYEGGIREAFIVKGPGISPATNTDAVVTGTDIYPTILELAGLPLRPTDHHGGVSFLDALKGNTYNRGKPIFWHSPMARPYSTGDFNSSAIRDGDYKLIWWYDTPGNNYELYNVKTDIGENTNLISRLPTKASELLNKLRDWRNGESYIFDGDGVITKSDADDVARPPQAWKDDPTAPINLTTSGSNMDLFWGDYIGFDYKLYSRTNLTEGSWTLRASDANFPGTSVPLTNQEFFKVELELEAESP